MSSRTAPYDLTHIRGYPDTLRIYRIDASQFWQCGCFSGENTCAKARRRQTRQRIEFAKRLFDEVKIAERLNVDIHPDTFADCAKQLIHRQEAMVGRDERDSRIITDDQRKLNKDILPWFGTMAVKDITTTTIDDNINELPHQQVVSFNAKEASHRHQDSAEEARRDYLRPLLLYRGRVSQTLDDGTAGEGEHQGLLCPAHGRCGTSIVFSASMSVRLSDFKVHKHQLGKGRKPSG